MSAVGCLRADRGAFSSLYGAFAVIVVATLVAGLILAEPGPDPASAMRWPRQADLFLDVLLSAPLNSTTENARVALSHACFAQPCALEAPSPALIMIGLRPVAENLSKAVGCAYRVAFSDGEGHRWEIGTLEPRDAAALSTTQLLNLPSGQLVAVTAFLGPA